jgi:hypothetical protein
MLNEVWANVRNNSMFHTSTDWVSTEEVLGLNLDWSSVLFTVAFRGFSECVTCQNCAPALWPLISTPRSIRDSSPHLIIYYSVARIKDATSVTSPVCIREVPGSNLYRSTIYYYRVLHSFVNVRRHFKKTREFPFLPSPFHLISSSSILETWLVLLLVTTWTSPPISSVLLLHVYFSYGLFVIGARVSVVGWGTMLQVGRSRVRFPMKLLDFSVYLIFPAELWSWGWLWL